MDIISKIIESGSYKTKTEQENEQALSLAAKGLINIAIGGTGKTNQDNTNQKIIPVITCSGTTKLRAVKSEITQGHINSRLTVLTDEKGAQYCRIIEAEKRGNNVIGIADIYKDAEK